MTDKTDKQQEMPHALYIQLADNRIGTELMMRRWQGEEFEGSTRYIKESDVSVMLENQMKRYRESMIALIRECGGHRIYRDLKTQDAFEKVATKLGELK